MKPIPLSCAPVFFGLLALLGCGDGNTNPVDGNSGPVPVTSVEVSAPATSLVAGQTLQLSATTKDAAGRILTGRAVTWSSSNPAAATVNGDGLVTGITPGTSIISATAEGKSGQIDLTGVPVPVASVTITPDTATLFIGTSRQLTAEVRDAAGDTLTGREVVWSSSDTSVAAVSSSGLVTAENEGTAMVNAASEGKSDTARIVVQRRPVAESKPNFLIILTDNHPVGAE